MGDAGRPTYDGLKQKVQEKDAQLDEALTIIKELTEALQGVRSRLAQASSRSLRAHRWYGCAVPCHAESSCGGSVWRGHDRLPVVWLWRTRGRRRAGGRSVCRGR